MGTRHHGIRWLPILLLLSPAPALAQTRNDPPPAERRNVVSMNPFSFLLLWPGVEYERRIAKEVTVGVRTDRLTIEEEESEREEYRFTHARVFLRVYPRAAYQGFYFDIGAGVTAARETPEDEEATEYSAHGAGFSLGYGWLMGSEHRFSLGLGAGLDRLFGDDTPDGGRVVPAIRLNVGYAF